jgi:sporulation protein YlmC with PRC-barrel domain
MSREPYSHASDILGRHVRTADGRDLGRVADIETDTGPDGRPRVTALIVTSGPWGRLLGYERDEVRGPWILERFARWILRRDTSRVPWDEAVLS